MARPGAAGSYRSAVQVDDPPGQRQSEAQAALADVEAAVRPGQGLVHPLQDLGGDAQAVVPDGEHRLAGVGVTGDLERDRAAAAGELQGVLEQAVGDTSEPRGVRPHPDRAGGDGHAQAQLGAVGLGTAALDRPAPQLTQVQVSAPRARSGRGRAGRPRARHRRSA